MFLEAIDGQTVLTVQHRQGPTDRDRDENQHTKRTGALRTALCFKCALCVSMGRERCLLVV